MPHSIRDATTSERYVQVVSEFIEREVANAGTTQAKKPGHRIPFHWPPHPVSYNYHVLASDWRGSIPVEIHGETFEVSLARTAHGVFGRCEALWAEAKGKTESDMVANLRANVEPLFKRQREVARLLGRPGRFSGNLQDLESHELLFLLYSEDRDIASGAQTVLETRSQKSNLLASLLLILRDNRHPNRRSAQWCVLDLFEDMPSYCDTEADELEAIEAIKEVVQNAEDDFARTIFKAGVVLGGHLPDLHGGPALIECLSRAKKIGRRSAIHGLFHVVEWHPELRDEVVSELMKLASTDEDAQLREYARRMANDIESNQLDHVEEPIFPDEV